MPRKITYKDAGVDIENADRTKREMAESLNTGNPLVLNKFGAFASLLDGGFAGYEHPVLVCKTEEPGSKQLLAFQYGKIEGICYDMINHLINDIIVMGAKPFFIQDLIVCGKMERDIIRQLVQDIASACAEQECVLTGGETSEQPGVLKPGTYVLGSSGIGVVEKSKIIDGSAIKEGDIVLAVASSGLHTNGYTLVRALLDGDPAMAKRPVAGMDTFIDAVLVPHMCYYKTVRGLFGHPGLHGMAHITGGGIPGNLNRILPEGIDAQIDASKIKILPIFKFIHRTAGNGDDDMIKTYNLGAGLTLVTDSNAAQEIAEHVRSMGVDCYPIGTIVAGGNQIVKMSGDLKW